MADTRTTVLVIDDEDSLRESIAVYLEDSGFLTLEASNGQQGLDLALEHTPDLIISDLRMPNMGGLVLLSKLREQTDIPVIVISGTNEMNDVVEALRLGAADFFMKPISSLNVLELSVTRAVESTQLRKENSRYLEALESDLNAGRQTQQLLLPASTFQHKNYTAAQKVIPSLYLSGDCVDYLSIDENKLLVYLGDVSGHGASSAFVTVLLNNIVTQLLQRYYRNNNADMIAPAKILDHINQELVKASLGKHVTMFLAIIDTQKNEMTYSVGGHYPLPILCDESDKSSVAEFVQGKALPVGLFDHASYENYSISLPEKFTFAIFSDGILEIMEESSLDEKENKLLSMLNQGYNTIEQMLAFLHVSDDINVPDDIALVTISRK